MGKDDKDRPTRSIGISNRKKEGGQVDSVKKIWHRDIMGYAAKLTLTYTCLGLEQSTSKRNCHNKNTIYSKYTLLGIQSLI